MTDQVHIRDAETAWLLRTLAKQSGMTMKDVLKDALKEYRPKRRAVDDADKRGAELLRLAAQDRQRLLSPEVPLESFYDPQSGLPV
jgi:hypothetical protein